MTCSDFERWLDEGMPVAQEEAAALHERSCIRCAAAHAAAREVEFLLSAGPAPAPAGLSSRIMARIDRQATARAATIRSEPALPWWVEWTREPAGTLSLVLAALLIWRGSWIWAQVQALVRAAPLVEWFHSAGAALAAARAPDLTPFLIPWLPAAGWMPGVSVGLPLIAVALLVARPLFGWSTKLGSLLASSRALKPI